MSNDPTPRISTARTPDGVRAVLQGDWSVVQLAGRGAWRRLAEQLRATPALPATAWSLEGVAQLDHVGAQLLWDHWGRAWPAQLTLGAAQRSMIERVARYTLATPPAAPRAGGFAEAVDHLGARVLRTLEYFSSFIVMMGQFAFDLLRLLRAPHRGPWRDISGHLYSMGATALPITALVGFLIGVVLAYLTSLQLRQFGAESFIVNILGIALIRELGPMLAAILVAGRSGSAITAQIGVMRVNEELDAMRVMGITYGFRLVLPRALALALAMPLVSVWTTLAALCGGMLAADLAMDITPAYFINALPRAVNGSNLTLACAKSVVFGLLIALVGCHRGLRVRPNTQSLGEGTTASVVTAITVVIVVDALFAVAFRNVGI